MTSALRLLSIRALASTACVDQLVGSFGDTFGDEGMNDLVGSMTL